ncbi:phosphohydrolase [Zooshikella harenae]|uniref:Phosphohydrolase n=1 Tax=Zooshikella harenae TaxID=2827238 RepID=A0ABS5Z9S2_9GAMM|nr:phosphohydrolase [Zooshikella harenae]MBU2710799.1 phosphohydrolase [Zooshikella harenae]
MNITDWENRFTAYLQKQLNDAEDKSHDLCHVKRVWNTAKGIMSEEGGNKLVVIAACYFHDIVNLPKNSPDRHLSSALAAQKTLSILVESFSDFPKAYYDDVEHAICAHSFSAGIKPTTLEAKIVQDADRIEALGAIGLARVFYVGGLMGQALFDGNDLFADTRELNDRQYALDHFQQKLLKLPETMQTTTGRKIAIHNANYLIDFMAKLSSEIKGEHHTKDPEVITRFGSMFL